MKINVAIATYNGQEYIEELLESIFNQESFRPNKIIVSDDCSSDLTVQKIKDIAEISEIPIMIYENKFTLGYSQNFSKALEIAHMDCDLVIISDQDDVWYPFKMKEIFKKINEDSNLSLLIHDADIVDKNLISSGATKLKQVKRGGDSNKAYVMGGCMTVYSKLLKIALPIPTHTTYDRWLSEISEVLNVKVILYKSLIMHRRHKRNATKANFSRIHKINFYQYLLSLFKRRNFDCKFTKNNFLYIKKFFKYKKNEKLSEELLYLLEEKHKLCLLRKDIRKKSFPLRLFSVLVHYDSYMAFSGIKSAFRDLLNR